MARVTSFRYFIGGLVLCQWVSWVQASMELHRMALINYDAITKLDSGSSLMSVSPDKIHDGDRVFVTYHLDAHPANKKDVFIAVYSPSTVDVTTTAPVAYKFLDPTAPLEGKSPFDLINMRADYVFVLFRGGLSAPVELTRSNTVKFYNYNSPRAGRLMHTQVPSEMMLSWSSARSDNSPRLSYWPCSAEQTKKVSPAKSRTWGKDDMCGAPATTVGFRDPGFVHTVVMSDLKPDTDYCYQYGADDETSPTQRFTTVSKTTYPYSVVTYGDEGQAMDDGSTLEQDFPYAKASSKLTQSLVQQQPSTTHLVLHFGDISYARGYAADWDIFTHMNRDVFNTVPYAVSLGNHEADFPDSSSYFNGTDSGGECGIPSQLQFPAPQPALNEPWYWFTSGPLFVLQMSTEHDYHPGSAQYAYIQEALSQKVDRSVTPWVVFTGHRPMYIDSTNNNTNGGDLPVAADLQTHIGPLLQNAGGTPVDITLWGHHHSYQRMCASFNGACMLKSQPNADGVAVYTAPRHPIALVVGTAGPPPSTNVQRPMPEYTEFVSFTHGVGYFTVHNASALQWFFYEDSTSNVIDQFWLLK